MYRDKIDWNKASLCRILLPISVPTRNIESTDSWEDGNFSYVKVKKGVRNFPLDGAIDVTAVVPKRMGMSHEILAKEFTKLTCFKTLNLHLGIRK